MFHLNIRKLLLLSLISMMLCCSCSISSSINVTTEDNKTFNNSNLSRETIEQFTIEYLELFKSADFETLSYYTNFSLSNLEAFTTNSICGDYVKSNLQDMYYTITSINPNGATVTINYINSEDITTKFILNSVYNFMEEFIDEDSLYDEFMSLKTNYPNQKIDCVTVNLSYIVDADGNIKLDYTPETSEAFYHIVSGDINQEVINYLF